ncbi:hypothetical protein GCM10020256_66390 [Streptomyces thermocoprophilus]
MATRTIQASSTQAATGVPFMGGAAGEDGPVHAPGPGDHGQDEGADDQTVGDDAERVGGVVAGVAAVVGEHEVADLAAGGAEREEQSERVEAEPGPHLDDAGEAAHGEDDAHGRGPGDGPPLHEPHPAEHERRRQILHEQRDADGDAGQGGEVAGLDPGHGQQPEPGEQRGTAARQCPVADGDRQHDEGGAGDPQPHHVQRVEAGLDQRFGGDSRSAEGEGRGEREGESDAFPGAVLSGS